MTTRTCTRCGHTPAEHSPAHGEPRTCCSTCLTEQNYTTDPVTTHVGLCCVQSPFDDCFTTT